MNLETMMPTMHNILKANAPPEPVLPVHCQQFIHQGIFINQININEKIISSDCVYQHQTEQAC